MSTPPDPRDYVRYALWSAGFNPTDEIVNQIYATGYPRVAVITLIVSLRTDPVASQALDFMEAMQKMVNGAGTSAEQIAEVSDEIRRMAE